MDRYDDDVIPPLTTLEGTITAVPNMQKQLFNYVIHWGNNASLTVSFDVNHLQVHCFKGDQSLMDLLKRARQLYDLKYPEANSIGPLKLPTNLTHTIGNLRQAHSTNTSRRSSRPSQTPEQELNQRQNVTLTTARMAPEIIPNTNPNNLPNTGNDYNDSSSDEGSEMSDRYGVLDMDDVVDNGNNYNV